MGEVEKEVLTARVYAALARRYASREWTLFYEVRNGDAARKRYADAIALDMFHAQGHRLHGFEVKVSRADWLKERGDGGKAEYFFQRCDKWWLVTSSDDVARKDELPPGWGWLSLRRGRVYTLVEAKQRDNLEPLDRVFLMVLVGALRRESDSPSDQRLRAEYHRGYVDGENQGAGASGISSLKARLASAERVVTEFSEASGVTLQGWNSREVGEDFAVFMALKDARKYLASQLEGMEDAAERLQAQVKEARAQLAKEATIPVVQKPHG